MGRDLLLNGVFYADTDAQIAKVVSALNRVADRGEAAGFDTEFYGVDLKTRSCVACSHLHLISVAVARHPRELHPFGYSRSDSAVLGRRALEHSGFRDWLIGPGPKAVHHLPVDAHTIANEGVKLGGGINTLSMARWAWPHRARGTEGGFTLDALGQDLCGQGKAATFQEIFREQIQVEVVKTRKAKGCECGTIPKRGHPRQAVPGHQRVVREERVVSYKTSWREVPLASVVPGHPLWPQVVSYSAQDAILALAVYELALNKMTQERRSVPWLTGSVKTSIQ